MLFSLIRDYKVSKLKRVCSLEGAYPFPLCLVQNLKAVWGNGSVRSCIGYR